MVQGAVALTVYVYTFPTLVQVPPASGVPPNCANNSALVGVVPWQTVKVPFVPALGCAWIVTVTVAVAFVVQGVVANMVYV